jgi:ribonuclease Y
VNPLFPTLAAAILAMAVVWLAMQRRLDEARRRALAERVDELGEALKLKVQTDEELLLRARTDAERIVEEAAARAKIEAQTKKAETDALTRAAELEAREIVQKARIEASDVTRQARLDGEAEGRTAAERLRADEEERGRREVARLKQEEDRLARREQGITDKERLLLERERTSSEKEGVVGGRETEVARREREAVERERTTRALESQAIRLVDDRRATLEAIAGLSGEDARRQIIEQQLDSARKSSAREAKAIEDAARDEAEKRAKRIVGIAVQRYAGDHVQERAVTTVHLPNDEMKGRIIGREGRNIRALQEATGVDFIVDDTPETIVISSFDPIRREVARGALEKLVADGRIHPTRIEEVVQKSQEEVERSILDAADRAMAELAITRVHPELMRLVGQLKYRYSYAQNVLKHSIECGFLAGLMASELGLNEKQARRAGLLHDIGKAVSHEVEGGHAVVGGVFARKNGEDEIVANAIACHHDEEPCISVIGHLVTAADALSGARPGARREMLESYVRRLSELEKISTSFAGVERSFAIQAGREVRVIVEPSEVSDAEAALLAREISRRIEEELAYPGQIKVIVVRETRAIDYAK